MLGVMLKDGCVDGGNDLELVVKNRRIEETLGLMDDGAWEGFMDKRASQKLLGLGWIIERELEAQTGKLMVLLSLEMEPLMGIGDAGCDAQRWLCGWANDSGVGVKTQKDLKRHWGSWR
ncbi:hypothetical protein SEMRO_554_G165440.1 [Seminavis robusta]|uniref:Uncharacterized protein n=1 Tax=Seminavis robusta TaxID=568900 RepID=A0A9N8E628_9STRA|nr:hypothetical protein SEMRO_554_G165440.1 [Seminavis robusta]|eukprot:Sro554_g165440.1 n/a (119) ;mRNA; f:7160-7516